MKIKEFFKSILGLNRKYPYLIAGYDIRRWEDVGGEEIYVPEFERRLQFMRGVHGEVFLKGTTAGENGELVCDYDVKLYGPTHLQYHSPYGFLIVWPFCIHVWYQFRQKQYDERGGEIPDSERIIYSRIGLARWDAGDGKYMIPTFYPPWSLHWD